MINPTFMGGIKFDDVFNPDPKKLTTGVLVDRVVHMAEEGDAQAQELMPELARVRNLAIQVMENRNRMRTELDLEKNRKASDVVMGIWDRYIKERVSVKSEVRLEEDEMKALQDFGLNILSDQDDVRFYDVKPETFTTKVVYPDGSRGTIQFDMKDIDKGAWADHIDLRKHGK